MLEGLSLGGGLLWGVRVVGGDDDGRECWE
jgi:hypothetical protein